MKKTYLQPECEIEWLLENDIVTLSDSVGNEEEGIDLED